VDEADWLGESDGVATVEFVEATDCCVVFRLRLGLVLRAVVDMIASGIDATGRRTAQSKMLKGVAVYFFLQMWPAIGGGLDTFCWDGAAAEWDFPSYRKRELQRAKA